MDLDWKSIAGTVAPFAPTLGRVLGAGFGPIGSTIGGIAGDALAAAFNTDATPEAVGKAIAEDPDASQKLQDLEAQRGQEILAQAQVKIEELKQQSAQFETEAADRQNARLAQFNLQQAGSSLAMGPAVVSVVIIAGFVVLSALAMKPEAAGVKENVTLYLLGAWQSLATMAAGYWLGSSAGSKNNADRLATLTQQIVEKPNPSPEAVAAIKTVAGKKR